MKKLSFLPIFLMLFSCAQYSKRNEISLNRFPSEANSSTVVGTGSVIQFIKPVFFGTSLSKRFCSGKEVSSYKNNCCEILLSTDGKTPITVGTKERILRLHTGFGQLSDGKITITCDLRAPTVGEFEKAFQGVIVIRKFEPHDVVEELNDSTPTEI
jgi:hypothetical protein